MARKIAVTHFDLLVEKIKRMVPMKTRQAIILKNFIRFYFDDWRKMHDQYPPNRERRCKDG